MLSSWSLSQIAHNPTTPVQETRSTHNFTWEGISLHAPLYSAGEALATLKNIAGAPHSPKHPTW
eukprot:10600528-Karenia_brevis.AAC.1